MKKHTSEEAYYERMRNLAQTKKTSIKESRTLGTLIDYKRAADGVAYGIIKEQHHYYVKKAGLKQDPNVSDFAYIGGLANVTDFQYKSLSEADKQRNMMFHTINEAVASKPSKTGSKKKRLNEDKAGQEIDQAASKLGDLDAATASAEAPAPEAGAEMAAGIDAMPSDAGVAPEMGAEPEMGGEEMPAPEAGAEPEMGGEEVAPEGEEEMPAPEGEETGEEGGAPAGEEGKDEATKEIEKSLGKLTNTLRKSELEPSQVKSYVNTFLSAFKDKFPDIEIEDRKAMAEKITKVVPDEDIEDLGQSVEDTEGAGIPEPEAEMAEAECSECGSFAKYAESRGYGSAQSLMECGEEEVGNLVSGYANAHNDGMNDGDLEGVALVVKVINPELLNSLRGDYGHEEYANKLQPHVDGMSESLEADNVAQLNELFGGLKNLGKAAGSAIGGAAKAAGSAIGGAAKSAYNAAGDAASSVKTGVQNAANTVKTGVQNAATNIKQTYNAGEINPEVKKLEAVAANLGKQIDALNKRMVGAGQQPVNVKSILATIQNQLGAGGQANLSKFRTAEGLDPAAVETQPIEEIKVAQKAGKKLSATAPVKPITEDEKPEEEEIETDVENGAGEAEEKTDSFFAPDSQSLGVATIKPEGAATTGVDITISPDKAVNISMNENEAKLRKYIRNRLEEMAGMKKPMLTESKKSDTLKKLDKVIEKQFKLHESVMLKKKDETLNEILGFSMREKFAKIDPNNQQEVDKLFIDAYRDILNNQQMGAIGRAAKRTTVQQRYELLKQYVEGGGGTLRLTPDASSVQFAPKQVKDTATLSQFRQGGTQGRTQSGGV
jgi:hypothetical protein